MTSFIRRALSEFLKNDQNFKWDDLNDAVVNRMASDMIQVSSPATVNTVICCLKGIAERLWIDDRIEAKTWQLISRIRRIHGSRISKGRMLQPDELKKLFTYCDRPDATLHDLRDAAMFAVMAYCGLRRSEVSGLRNENVFLEGKEPYVRLIGKGNKERVVPLPEEAVKRMKTWKEQRGTSSGPFFLAVTRDENIADRGLHPTTVYKICQTTAIYAKMRCWTPHDLRRTCASTLIAKGVDLTTVRDWLGHASVTSTQLYDKRSQKRLRDVAEKFSY